MPQGQQVKNGKAFEYALAKQYCEYITNNGAETVIEENDAYRVAKRFYDEFEESAKEKFDNAAIQTIDTMIKIEPGLLAAKDVKDVLHICLLEDNKGEDGDVRDVVFTRHNPSWEIGFSAKNNNDAVKHSRLSHVLDFGKEWLGIPCSQDYWKEIAPVFDWIQHLKEEGKVTTWKEIEGEKPARVYEPLLEAFRKELIYINENNKGVPSKLISYLIGKYPFYKIIKDDAHNMVIVKAFNINGGLNKTVNKQKSRYKVPTISLPKRIVEFKMKENSRNTLNMILDGGWEVSFRIHSAATKLEPSLKFDIQLLGNPPILFTQHLFQD